MEGSEEAVNAGSAGKEGKEGEGKGRKPRWVALESNPAVLNKAGFPSLPRVEHAPAGAATAG